MNNKSGLKCSYCICVYNEAQNIGFLLEQIRKQKTYIADIKEVILVASGCSDDTVKIINEKKELDDRIKIITQKERKGKASAINEILGFASGEIVILQSADTLITSHTIDRLINPFLNDDKIGMVGAHPVPLGFNKQDNFISYLGYLQWWFHDKISQRRPKMGELVAFRNVVKKIPEDVSVDEAAIENLIETKGYKLFYSKKAYVFNKTAETLKDFLIQRKRIHAGHEHIYHKYRYRVATYNLSILLGIITYEIMLRTLHLFKLLLSGKIRSLLLNIIKYSKRFVWLQCAALFDGYAHLLGYFNYRIRKKDYFIWGIAESTKKLINP